MKYEGTIKSLTANTELGLKRSSIAIAITVIRGHSRENRILETATQVRCMCFYAPIGP
jgi:hypothetical protein